MVLCGFAACASVHTAMAQDIIVLNNEQADELEVKIVEVTDRSVKYRKWSYQDGPVFTVATDAIFMIKYQNGEKQRFAVTSQPEPVRLNERKKRLEETDAPTPVRQARTETQHPADRSAQSATRAAAKPLVRRFDNFTPHVAGGLTAGYMLGLGDFSSDAINFMDLNMGWQFNPYFWLGGSIGNSFSYDQFDPATGFVGITANARGFLPLSKKVSLFGEFGIGVGIGYGWCDTDYLLRVGPGVKIGSFTVAPLYNRFGKSGSMLFQVGWHY